MPDSASFSRWAAVKKAMTDGWNSENCWAVKDTMKSTDKASKACGVSLNWTLWPPRSSSLRASLRLSFLLPLSSSLRLSFLLPLSSSLRLSFLLPLSSSLRLSSSSRSPMMITSQPSGKSSLSTSISSGSRPKIFFAFAVSDNSTLSCGTYFIWSPGKASTTSLGNLAMSSSSASSKDNHGANSLVTYW